MRRRGQALIAPAKLAIARPAARAARKDSPTLTHPAPGAAPGMAAGLPHGQPLRRAVTAPVLVRPIALLNASTSAGAPIRGSRQP